MSLELFQAITKLLPNPVLLCAADGEILSANPAATRFDGRLATGGNLLELDVERAPRLRTHLDRWLRSGNPLPGALVVKGADGAVTRFRCHGARARWWKGPLPAVQLHLVQLDHTDQFVTLSQQVTTLNREVAFRRTVEAERERLLASAQATHARLQNMYRLTAALASSATLAEVSDTVEDAAPAAIPAEAVALRLHSQRLVPDLEPAESPRGGGSSARTAPPGGRTDRRRRTADTPAGGSPAVQRSVPLEVNGLVIGALVVTDDPDAPPEHEHLSAIAQQIAQAVHRAGLYEHEHRVAERLQLSLLPARLPELDRLALAARYLPATENTQAGGDWYEVLALDGDRAAIVVGDVVGHGPRAAAVMGQLRSVLSSALLQGHGPAAALEVLDRFATGTEGATGSTAACLILHLCTGRLTWSVAGHPPPLLIGRSGACYLDHVRGTVLGVRGRPPFPEGTTDLEPGTTTVLYTDGLVERRREGIDTGLARLAAAGGRLHLLPPEELATALLSTVLKDEGPPDDIALIAARLLPAPLHERLPARPAELPALRRRAQAWAHAGGLHSDTIDDLQLAFGEAATNAVEHGYHDRPPGEFDYTLARTADGGVQVQVQDFGHWRPPPADTGYRGRGLYVIDQLATDLTIDRGAHGTTVSFRVPPARQPTATPVPTEPAPRRGPTPGTPGLGGAAGDGLGVRPDPERSS